MRSVPGAVATGSQYPTRDPHELPALLSLSLLSATARFFKQRLIVDRIQFRARVWFDSVIPIGFVHSIFESLLTLTQSFRQLRQLAAAEQQKDRGHNQNYDSRTFQCEQQHSHRILLQPFGRSSSADAEIAAAVGLIEKILAPGFVGPTQIAHDLAIDVQ